MPLSFDGTELHMQFMGYLTLCISRREKGIIRKDCGKWHPMVWYNKTIPIAPEGHQSPALLYLRYLLKVKTGLRYFYSSSNSFGNTSSQVFLFKTSPATKQFVYCSLKIVQYPQKKPNHEKNKHISFNTLILWLYCHNRFMHLQPSGKDGRKYYSRVEGTRANG